MLTYPEGFVPHICGKQQVARLQIMECILERRCFATWPQRYELISFLCLLIQFKITKAKFLSCNCVNFASSFIIYLKILVGLKYLWWYKVLCFVWFGLTLYPQTSFQFLERKKKRLTFHGGLSVHLFCKQSFELSQIKLGIS